MCSCVHVFSFKDAIAFAKRGSFDVFVAVGGGSVIDTCKAANLYASHPDAHFLDFVNAPIGKGRPVTGALKPLIAGMKGSHRVSPGLTWSHRVSPGLTWSHRVSPGLTWSHRVSPGLTWSHLVSPGLTGSHLVSPGLTWSHRVSPGIASRALRPLLGVVDPLHTLSLPPRVAANSGFDVLWWVPRDAKLTANGFTPVMHAGHALESYTALPYHQRAPCPPNPRDRPAYQGSNPISDVWSRHALRVVAQYLKRSDRDQVQGPGPGTRNRSRGTRSRDQVQGPGGYISVKDDVKRDDMNRAVRDPEDREARSSMHLASVFAGIGFGNAGVHLW
ncbi:Hydroxyacid-oxoacid transhydrogenase, mitochondrial [Liparis tanakae]|uniref:Hydroxyacid-oxoacid transhydrogenase, mitochondrial n=1 Tax=Liparis tanakae TaxID=230148 RepID=A0A4Z2E5A2_9TELE|nr:Hydroxyacid-oxoacid transhydrogenase, mitochondrial [Liparis tanakae]